MDFPMVIPTEVFMMRPSGNPSSGITPCYHHVITWKAIASDVVFPYITWKTLENWKSSSILAKCLVPIGALALSKTLSAVIFIHGLVAGFWHFPKLPKFWSLESVPF
jgi:hypothetical protein